MVPTIRWVVFLRSKYPVATKFENDVPVKRFWVIGNEGKEIFSLREQLSPKDRASGKRPKCELISARTGNVELVDYE